jgi:tetratricopeptide (TPR) repeat protein
MNSRFLARIDSKILEHDGSAEADCLRAERAGYLARLGEFEQASQAVAVLQSAYRTTPHPHVTAWLKFAEAMIGQHRSMSPAAHDSLKRAKALAAASGAKRLQALAAAWMSYFDFTRLDVPSIVGNLREALELSAAADYSTQARATLVIAQSFDLCSGYEEAAPWYEKCRLMAVEDGDELMLSALLHNKAWLGVANQRFHLFTRTTLGLNSPSVRLGAASTVNFDQMIGLKSLDTFGPLLRAQILLLNDQVSEALQLLEEYGGASNEQGLGRLQSSFRADQAYCYAKLGMRQKAELAAESASSAIAPDVQLDDRAATYSRLRQVHALLGDQERVDECERLASIAWADFEVFRIDFAKLLRKLPALHA